MKAPHRVSRLWVQAVVAMLMVASTGSSIAADFPTRPLRLIVPYPPGGGTDIVARLVGQKLTEAWKQSVIIDNRAGASGNIGTELAARAAPDGYTIVLVAASFAINAGIYKSLPYDAVKDFAAVSQLTSSAYILVVHPSVAANSVGQLVELARAKPNALAYATTGNGSPPHMAAELMKKQFGINMLHVPYKGAAPAVIDLIAGQVQVLFGSPYVAPPHIRSGRLRALAVTTAKRYPVVPDLPTMSEAGAPGYEVDGWYGILAPAGTPATIVNKLSSQIVSALHSPDNKESFTKESIVPVGTAPGVFSRYIKAEIEKWGKFAGLAD